MAVFDLMASLGLDTEPFEKGLENSKKTAKSFTGTIGGGIAKGAKAAFKAVTVATGAAAAGVAALTKQSISAYGEYEQLAGGVKKLFGNAGMSLEDYAKSVGKTVSEVSTEYNNLEAAQNKVFENAKQAFKTTGMSTNTYIDTVTSFSSSLIQGLGGDTQKAADLADTALRDMGDNFNTFGGDLDMVMNAYKGFAKGNFTMLDNLKLGYGGTKSEMMRLVKESGVLGDAAKDLTLKNFDEKVSFDKIIEAVHLTQQQMGITNTTINEASSTIQGSVGALGAAWENLVAGFSNPDADLGVLIDNVIKSAQGTLKNIIPTISNALKGIGKAIEEVAPIIAEELPGLVNDILPPLLQAAISLVNSLVNALPGILNVLPTIVNQVLPPLLQACGMILKALIQALPGILSVLKEIAPLILQELLPALLEILPDLISTALQLLIDVVQALAENADTLVPMITEVIIKIAEILTNPDVLVPLLEAGSDLLIAITKGLADATPTLLQGLGRIIVNLVEVLKQAIPLLVTTAGGMVYELVSRLGTSLGNFLYDIFGTKIYDIIQKVKDKINGAREFIGEQIQKIKDFFSNLELKLPDFKLPHFKLEGEFSLNPPKIPSIGVDWYAKGYDEAYMLNSATIFGAQGGKLLGGGEKAGSEVVVGTNKLISMMTAAVQNAFNGIVLQANVPVYIGNKKLEDIIVKTQTTMKIKRGK